ncbi:hypothetical protein LPJ81_004167, partial [Coemansia sp. IMI 209127]
MRLFDKQPQTSDHETIDDADGAGVFRTHRSGWSHEGSGDENALGSDGSERSNDTACAEYTRARSQTADRSRFGASSSSSSNDPMITDQASKQNVHAKRFMENFLRRGSETDRRLFSSSRPKSFSHDCILNHTPRTTPLTYCPAAKSITQDTIRSSSYHRCQQQQNRQQPRCSAENSPDLLNSRQLRRRVARYSSSYAEPRDEEEAIFASISSSQKLSEISILGSLKNAALSSWLNVLIIFVPLGYLAYFLKWPVIAVFVLNYLAIVPLSALMGFATEEVSIRLGSTWGSVVNASFGNAVELIVAVIALIEEEYRIVQAGLIGSVLSNTLFLLGCAFLAGGLRHRVQMFHAEAAQCAGSLLALSVLSIIVPAAYHSVHAPGGEITNGILIMSRGTALILLLVYVLFLVFQLKTHSDIFDGSHTRRTETEYNEEFAETVSPNVGLNVVLDDTKKSRGKRAVFSESSCKYEETSDSSRISIDDDVKIGKAKLWRQSVQETHHHHSAPQMQLWMAGTMLALVSVLVALSSDVLVDSVEELTSHYNISHTFVGMILLPLAASAAEHTMSVTVAIRDKMDLCITIAVGSSMQMTLFVLPTLIIIAWIMKRPLTLYFDEFETTTLLISVLVINYLIMNGRSNWLKGAMLLSS